MTETGSMMSREQCEQDVRRMATRTALLYHYFVTTLVGHLGEQSARELTAEAIARYGEHVGRKVREGVEAQGLTNDIENYSKAADLPSVGWEGAVAQTEHGPRSRVTYCPLAAVWQELGSQELGRIYCAVDQAKYRAYNPRARLLHTCNVLDGDAYCEFDVQIEEQVDVG